jgi:hypothetical protein
VSGNEVSIGLKVPRLFFGGFPTFRPLIWSLRLNEQIPLSLDVEAGANETRIDLEALKIEDLRLKTGASDTRVTLPAAAGMTKVRIEAGAASVRVRVPEGVAARIRAEAGLAEISVDQTRFPKQDGTYLSADYEEAENKADLHLSAGVGAIDVR